MRIGALPVDYRDRRQIRSLVAVDASCVRSIGQDARLGCYSNVKAVQSRSEASWRTGRIAQAARSVSHQVLEMRRARISILVRPDGLTAFDASEITTRHSAANGVVPQTNRLQHRNLSSIEHAGDRTRHLVVL